MHIIVCIKQVPDASEVKIDPETGTLIRSGVPSIVNPYDSHALEAAVRIKKEQGGRVTTISMGPPQAVEALRRAVAFGIDDAVLLTDRAFAGSDTLATSYVLAQAIRRVEESYGRADLVFCGKEAIDGDTGQVGPGVSTRLGFAQLTYVVEIQEVLPKEGIIRAWRDVGTGRELVEAKLPALLTVTDQINEPHYASLPNMIRAARYEVAHWGKDDIELDLSECGLKGSPTKVAKVFTPKVKVKRDTDFLDEAGGDVKQAAEFLAQRLLDKGVVGGEEVELVGS